MGCANPTLVPLLGGCCPGEVTSARYISAVRYRWGYAGFANRRDPIGPRIQLWTSYRSRATIFSTNDTAEASGSIDLNTGVETKVGPVYSPGWSQFANEGIFAESHEERYTVSKTSWKYEIYSTFGGVTRKTFENEMVLEAEQESTIGWVDSVIAFVNSQDVNAVTAGAEWRIEPDGRVTEISPQLGFGNGQTAMFIIPAGLAPEADLVKNLGVQTFRPVLGIPAASQIIAYARKSRWISNERFLRRTEQRLRGVSGYPYTIPGNEMNELGLCRTYELGTVIVDQSVRYADANSSLTLYRLFNSKTPDPCSVP
jgi:hypothetical protein